MTSRLAHPLLAVILLAAGGCVTKAKYGALATDLASTRQDLQAANDAAVQAAARCNSQQADADARLVACEERALGLSNERDRQAAAARANELAAQDLAAELKAQEDRLARMVKDKSRLDASIEQMRRALAVSAERERQAARRVAEFKDMLVRFKDLIDAGTLQVRIVDGRMVLTLPMDILFPSGSARLSKAGQDAVLAVGRGLATIPDRRFQIEGHTDDVPIRTAAYPSNWELAAGRALVVVRALLAAGVLPASVSAGSFAEHRPTAPNDGDVNRARNRRIEIVVLPDLSSLPGYDELKRLSSGG